MKRAIILFTTILIVANPAFPFGKQGHQAIGRAAEGLLNQRALAAIHNILPQGESLASIATWADDVRGAGRGNGPLANDPEALAFNKAFPDNGNWHFVDLPLGSSSYEDDGPFSRKDDVVHQLNESIRVLEGSSTSFNKLQALRYLVHLVGDIHQPLHVACGFFQIDEQMNTHLIEDPAKVKGLPDDKGGNDLFFGPGNNDELHAFWDTALVTKVDGATYESLAAFLTAKIKDPNWVKAHRDDWDTAGDYHTWAEKWATMSIKQARAAYAPLQFGKATLNGGRLRRIDIILPTDYVRDETNRETRQLAAAAHHLAAVLNNIQWK